MKQSKEIIAELSEFVKEMGNPFTRAVGNVLTEILGKVLNIYSWEPSRES